MWEPVSLQPAGRVRLLLVEAGVDPPVVGGGGGDARAGRAVPALAAHLLPGARICTTRQGPIGWSPAPRAPTALYLALLTCGQIFVAATPQAVLLRAAPLQFAAEGGICTLSVLLESRSLHVVRAAASSLRLFCLLPELPLLGALDAADRLDVVDRALAWMLKWTRRKYPDPNAQVRDLAKDLADVSIALSIISRVCIGTLCDARLSAGFSQHCRQQRFETDP